MSRITYTVLVETLNNVLSIIKADVTLRRLRQCRRRRLLAALLGLPLCFCSGFHAGYCRHEDVTPAE